MSTVTISAADVNKLRKQTGAGMMDCKKALMEANGDFDQAIDFLRKKGQKVATNRADRETNEGYILAKTNDDATKGYLVGLSCETDFVTMSEDFTSFVSDLLDLVIANNVTTSEELKALPMGENTVAEKLLDMIGKIGEKIDIAALEVIEAPQVVVYIHPGNKVVSVVGMSTPNSGSAGKDVAMQVAAMKPVALDKDDVDSKTIEREIEVGKEQAREEGKPEAMLEKIAMGKLNKFYKENTLMNQQFIKEDKMDVRTYLDKVEKGLTVKVFRRVQMG